MTAELILQELTERGVRVWAESGRLKLDVPAGALTEEDKARLTQRKSDLLALLATCKQCSGAIQADSGDRWRHSWCANGCFDRWEATDGGKLSDSGAPGFGQGQAIVAELLALHQCPDGCGPLVLQDRAGDVWFCSGCRLWVVAGVIQ